MGQVLDLGLGIGLGQGQVEIQVSNLGEDLGQKNNVIFTVT